MDAIRQGEIALLLLKDKIRQSGIKLSLNTRREIGNTAKTIGISLEEATEFSEILVRGLVEEAFPKKQIVPSRKMTG